MKKISPKLFKKADIERLQKGYYLFEHFDLVDIGYYTNGYYTKEQLEVVLRKTPVELIAIDDFLELVCQPCISSDGISDCKNCKKRLKLIATYLATPFKDKIQSYKNFCSLYLMIEAIHTIIFSPLKNHYIDELNESILTNKEKQVAIKGIKYLPDYDLFNYYAKVIGKDAPSLESVEDLYVRYVKPDEMERYVYYRIERERDVCCLNKEDLWEYLNDDSAPDLVLHINNEHGSDTRIMSKDFTDKDFTDYSEYYECNDCGCIEQKDIKNEH